MAVGIVSIVKIGQYNEINLNFSLCTLHFPFMAPICQKGPKLCILNISGEYM